MSPFRATSAEVGTKETPGRHIYSVAQTPLLPLPKRNPEDNANIRVQIRAEGSTWASALCISDRTQSPDTHSSLKRYPGVRRP